MDIFDYMGNKGYEQLAMFSDAAVGLKSIIAIHDTSIMTGLGVRPINAGGTKIREALCKGMQR